MKNLSEEQISQSVSIIGMAGRFPGADSISTFWKNLVSGTCSLETLTDESQRASGVPDEILKNPRCIKRAGVLHNSDMFDANFFGYSPREAELIDPQQRLFLECAWEAFEDAGYTPESVKGPVSVFAGAGMNYYFIKNLLSQRKRFEDIVDFLTFIGNDKDYLCSRVSYKFGFTGPSFVVNSACSTSLVAVQVGYQSLLTGQSDLALCGGVALQSPRARASLYNEGEIFSLDGYCRTFDKNTDGIVFGEGLGLVLLKRTEDAINDCDHIYAIIRSAAVNNDGSAKAGYTAPGVSSQTELIALAQDLAGVHPDEISFIEAHGTGTKLGDVIEVSALTKAFQKRTRRKHFCALGSVKTNIGHLDAASGITGLIKTALALDNRLLPASLNCIEENPELALENSPFFVAKKQVDFKDNNSPLIAGVSSFGMGGTNVHVIVQEPIPRHQSVKARTHYLVPLSAQTKTALDTARKRLIKYIEENKEVSLQDLAYTLQIGRRAFSNRLFTVCTDMGNLVQALGDNATMSTCKTGVVSSQPVIFSFSGQGAQYPGMGLRLYESESVVHNVLDQAREIMRNETGEDLFSILFPSSDITSKTAEQTLTRTSNTQPALFAVEYALARLFISYGISPAACIGHSIGEYTAATIAGVFTFEQGMKIVLQRGRIMDAMQPGSMAFVALSEDELLPHLSGNLVIALVNGPCSCVTAGPTNEVTVFIEKLKQNNIRCGLLRTSHAFHSAMMEDAANQFKEFLDGISLRKPEIPFISNVSGTWITGEQCTSSQYWADQLRKTVRFSDGVSELLTKNYRLFLEIGPGNTLSTLIGMHPVATGSIITVPSLRNCDNQTDDLAYLTGAIGNLWAAGASVDWKKLYTTGEIPNRISLPTYPFERKRYWIEYCAPHHTSDAHGTLSWQQKSTTDTTTVNEPQSTLNQMVDLSSREELTRIVSEAWVEVLQIDYCDNDASFLALGGNSLMLSQVVARLNKSFPYVLHMSFMMGSYTINEQVERLLEFGRSNSNSNSVQINEPVQHAEKESLSPAQQRLWYLCQLNQQSPAFNLTHTFRLRGPLNVQRLNEAVRVIVHRHPSLRSTFSHTDGIPVVRVNNDVTVSFSVTECECREKENSEQLAAAFIRKEAAILYDLERGPLFKCRLYRIATDEFIFVFFVHHIISDGWSMAIILKELSTIYNVPEGQQYSVLPNLKINYFDYAAFMNRLEDRPIPQEDITFWKQYFKDGLPILSLPIDFPRPKTLKFTAKLLTFTLPQDLSRKISAYAELKKITPFSVLMSIYALLLSRHSRQDRIIIGCPIAGRNRVEFEPLIGLFLNMIPFNIKFDSGMTIENLIEQTYQNTVQVFAHQNLQFGRLVEILQPERHLNINHVFQTMFSYNNYLFSSNTAGEVVFEPEKSDRGSSEYDLSLYMWSSNETLHGAFEYNDELFLESTIKALHSQFQTLLEAALNDPSLQTAKAPLFSKHEISKILARKYLSSCDIPEEQTLHSMLDRSFLSNQQAVAITDGFRALRYGELYNLSNQVCNGLRCAGVEPEMLVGVHMSRSINILPVLLGILKAGAAYIPLDPRFPTERIEFMICDADLRFIVTDVENGKRFSGNDVIHVLTYDDKRNDFCNQSIASAGLYGNSESLAYILYTSGSTGAPKGVEIQHKAVVNFLLSMQKNPGIDKNDNLLAITTISFDISGLELFLPLLAGAKITIVDGSVAADAFELRKWLENSGITIMQATPTTWKMLLEAGWSNGTGLKILCGGEAMSRELANKLLSTGAQVWNMYGPTETTIWSSIGKILTSEREPDLGTPIDNTQFFFLDDALQEVPRGTIAELCIGGTGLAKAYHNNRELTEKKFVTISIGGKEIRVYRTGDLVHVRADRTIEFLGRTDQQVKIRGYRIELEEIEMILNRHPLVSQAVVSTYTTAVGKDLVAYVKGHHGSQPNMATIRIHLEKHLPSYMIPATIIGIEEFPLTPNGKIDRLKLPSPQQNDKGTIQHQAPRDTLETQLVQIWEKFLGKKVHSIDANYFDLGGHSLLAVQIFNEIHKIYDLRLPLAVLIEHSTVRTFAAYLREIIGVDSVTISVTNTEITGTDTIVKPENSSPIQNLRLGCNRDGRPIWLIPKQDQPNTYIPFSNANSITVDPFTPPQKVLIPTPAQAEIWNIVHSKEQANLAYTETMSVRLTGDINEKALAAAIQGLPVLHEILRGHFSADGKKFVIEQHIDVPVTCHNLPAGSDHQASVVTFESDEAKRTFDLCTGPLVRVTILKSDNNEQILLLGAHASIVDGWSFHRLVQDLSGLYTSFAGLSAPSRLPDHGFSDYTNYRTSPEFVEQNQSSLFYWHSRLALPPLPHQPKSIFNDNPLPAAHTFDACVATLRLTGDTVSKIRLFARHNGVSVFSVLFAAISARILYLSSSDDTTIGVSFAGQLESGMDDAVGRFVNIVPIRIRSRINIGFTELCHVCHTQLLNDGSNAGIEMEELSKELNLSEKKKQILQATRLTHVQQLSEEVFNFGGNNVSCQPIPRCAASADLELLTIETNDYFQFIAYGNVSLTTKDWLNQFLNELQDLLIQNCTIKENINKTHTNIAVSKNDDEIFLRDLWKRILGVTEVDFETTFYALGGNSLFALQMLNEIFRSYKIKLPLSTLITHNTIRALASHLRRMLNLQGNTTLANSISSQIVSSVKKPVWNTIVTFKKEGELPPFFCVSGLGGNPMIFQHLSKALDKSQPFYALQFRGVDGILEPHKTVEDMATEFMADIRRIKPEGPYYIGGYSFGGLVAYEMIQRLIKNREQVGGLILIDTFIPHFNKSKFKRRLLTRLSNLLPTGSGYNNKSFKSRLRSILFQVQPQPEQTNNFINRFNLVSSHNHQAGVQYKPLPIQTNVVFVKSAIRVPPERYGIKLALRNINEWEHLIPRDRLDLRFVQTHHYELLNELYVGETAQKITEGLAALREKYNKGI